MRIRLKGDLSEYAVVALVFNLKHSQISDLLYTLKSRIRRLLAGDDMLAGVVEAKGCGSWGWPRRGEKKLKNFPSGLRKVQRILYAVYVGNDYDEEQQKSRADPSVGSTVASIAKWRELVGNANEGSQADGRRSGEHVTV
jgi:hypothetical protein